MARALMATCVLVAIVLPRFIHGRPAIDNDGSTSNILVTRGSKLGDFVDYERNAISSLLQGSASIPVKTRQRRLSDQRRAELETLMTLSKVNGRVAGNRRALLNRKLDPAKIGRRRRSATDLAPPERLISIYYRVDKSKRNGDPAYPLVS